MTRSWFGLLLGVTGAAFTTWWWTRRDFVARQMSHADRGEVIFRNAPAI
jgi:hypothetical protein